MSMPSLRRGDLRHRIVIQSDTGTADPAGDPAEAWTAFATVWAHRRDVGAREALAAGAQRAIGETVFRIEWLAGVTAKMRITLDGETWQITGIAEIVPRVGLEIMATRRIDD